jgi:hypothetical protein
MDSFEAKKTKSKISCLGTFKVSALLYSKVEVLYNFHIRQMFEALKEPGDTLIAAMPTICFMN